MLWKRYVIAQLFVVVAASSAIAQAPSRLGYHAAQSRDETVVALLADRILQGVERGDVFMFSSLVAEDYCEHLDPNAISVNSNSPSDAALPGRRALFSALANRELATEVKAKLDWSLKEIIVEDDKARSSILVRNGEGASHSIELRFRKREGAWLLTESSGLVRLMDSVGGEASSSLNKRASSLVLWNESSQDETFVAKELSSEHHLTKLTRRVASERLNRNLFGLTSGSALFAQVRELETAPYVQAIYVQFVTDPAWNRIIYGNYEKWIKAYDGREHGLSLNRPQGIAVDPFGNVYVADSGNGRIVVLQFEGAAHNLSLKYHGLIGAGELSQPVDVAWDDRGTLFNAKDDLLWIVDRGRAALRAYHAISGGTLVLQQQGLSDPVAVACGRFDGRSDGHVYVADAGDRSVRRYQFDGSALIEAGNYRGGDEFVPSSLSTDHWGNVYLTETSFRQVHKLSPVLEPLAILDAYDASFQPIRFQSLFGSVLPKNGEAKWGGYDQAFVLENWSDESGGRRYELGIDFRHAQVRLAEDLSEVTVGGTLTDAGKIKVEIVRENSTEAVAIINDAWKNTGSLEWRWDRRDANGEMVAAGYYRVRQQLQSTYDKPTRIKESTTFYLPLYYYEDCGAGEHHDPHLVQGQREIARVSNQEQTVAVHEKEVIYRFNELDATSAYEVKASYFSATGIAEQALYAENSELHAPLQVGEMYQDTEWLNIPNEAIADGTVEIRSVKTGGEGNASLAELWLRQADYDPNHPPQREMPLASLPYDFELQQNYPNPFNPTTTISYKIPEGYDGAVTLRIYNMMGEMVRELVNHQSGAGTFGATWNGLNDAGRPLATGVYLYQLRAGSFVSARKLVLMK